MLTIEELEAACDASDQVQFPRKEIETPELSFEATYYPYGFPAEVRTNDEAVLEQMQELWGRFNQQHDTEPVRCNIQLVESICSDCPPAPSYRLMLPFMICVADSDNYSIADLERSCVEITISRAALRHPLYAQYFILGTPYSCIATRYVTGVHAGCVALAGRGVLLCGDSGAGKSTLSYACARAGWTYVSDDGSFLLNGGTQRLVTGNCYQVRFRPSVTQLFPELAGLEITPRAAGKPSIELPTSQMTNISCTPTVRAEYIVFLNRRAEGEPQLVPYRKDVARQYMRQGLYGPADIIAVQHAAIERLLAAEVFELRYTELDWAIERLRTLVVEGR